MPITNAKLWREYEAKNTDPYGKCCVNVAREVMRLIDKDANGKLDAYTLINKADDNIKAGGITGFMASCAAKMVWSCHSRGDEFRLAWNGDHGVPEDKAKGGIVNSAIFTVGADEQEPK